jgi:hypothetical protein
LAHQFGLQAVILRASMAGQVTGTEDGRRRADTSADPYTSAIILDRLFGFVFYFFFIYVYVRHDVFSLIFIHKYLSANGSLGSVGYLTLECEVRHLQSRLP